jgi:hypothetical protein
MSEGTNRQKLTPWEPSDASRIASSGACMQKATAREKICWKMYMEKSSETEVS